MTTKYILMFAVLLILNGCQDKVQNDEATAWAEIMELHNLQKEYHINKMAEEFVSQLSSNHISVNRGEIASPPKEENLKRVGGYFNIVEFEKWDDINTPIIRFSDDYSMAYTVVQKAVQVVFTDEIGEKQRELTEFAWTAIYRRYEDGWKIDCITSTNKPGVLTSATE